MIVTESDYKQIPDSFPSSAPADPRALEHLYTLYTESTEKLRLAFERLEKRFREIDPCNIYNSINEALITLDQDEKILTFNRAAVRIFSLEEQDAIGKPFRECLPVCAKAFREYLEAGSPEDRYEISFRSAQGGPVVLRGRFSDLMDRNGETIGTTCLLHDLTVERLLEEKARRSDRLAALGELAAGVAHEMRNPLTTVRGYLQILPQFKDDEDFIQEFSDNLIREIDRLTRLTDDLLNMAKPIAPERKPEQLSALVVEVADFLNDKIRAAHIEIAIEDDNANTPVLIDADRMKQVFINLFVNAIEALQQTGGRSGRICVRFSQCNEILSEDQTPQTYAVAEISDNGPGIPPPILERLFDPFFTTKETGTGLGLSLSNRIVEEHGGFLRVSSVQGEGAAFWVMLPLAETPGDQAAGRENF
ncbi:MAG: PAS domain-containing protein [Candidatus Omnitrophica bacterium]|nr:PAS domain-containing protein [Candidatus Omnitrophota bacterium]